MGGPAKDRWIGATLGNGRYKITRKLGEGGMGSVYVAWDANLQTEVVVKVPHATQQDDPEATTRFVREASSLVKLSHPHIVKIVDFGEQAGQPYAVMQFLSGGSLTTRQGDEGQPPRKLPAESLKEWLPSIAKALDFVHAQGYLHRDVKPANILFDSYGNAFLSDFGITKFAVARQAADSGKSLTGAGMVLGTPEYMAPEVIMGQPADGRLDQYGLAVTVYELLAGRRPFEDATATAVLVQHTAQQPPDVRSFNGDVSPALGAVIGRALAKEPAKRFATCVAFADAAIAAISARQPGESARLKLKCPACQKTLKVENGLQGRTVPCPACGVDLKVSDDLREVMLVRSDAQTDRLRGGTRAVVAGDLLKRASPEAPVDIPLEATGEAIAHPDDFWETDGILLPPADSQSTRSLAAPGIPTQSSKLPVRKRTSGQSKSRSRGKASPASRNKLIAIIVSSSAAVLCLLGVAVYFASTSITSARRENSTGKLDGSEQAVAFAKNQPVPPKLHRPFDSSRTDNSGTDAAATQSPPRSAIFNVYVSPVTARLSVNNPAVEVSGSGSLRRVVVSDPQTIRSITLNLAADGYDDRQRELATRPGSSTSFRLSLQRSHPNDSDHPAAETEAKAQTLSSTKPEFQVAIAKPLEPKPKPQALSHETDAPATKAPDAFDGDRPGKVRMDNGLKTMLVWIPPGHFTMGTPAEQGKHQDEGPVEVTLTQGFWLGTYEVTQAEWHSVMHTTPWHGQLYVQEAENDAASYINWEEATAFCAQFTKQEHAAGRLPANWNYALPTEAQWEYACRAGTTTLFNFGKAVSQLPEYAWFAKNASFRHEEYAHRVGGMNENHWGVHDTHGNVSEWCRDFYTPDLPGGTDPEVVGNGSQRVLRGGGWRSNYDDCRSASRNRAERSARSPAWGLRIAAIKQPDLRLGPQGTPAAEALKTREQVNELVLQSYGMIKHSNFNGARQTLEKASRIAPSSIVADGTLGLLFSISSPENRSPKLAEKYFRTALHRSPNDVATLNNLALVEIRLHKYAEAIRYLKEASKESPDSEEVLRNLGRFVSEARSRKIHPPPNVQSEATGIYGKAAAAKQGNQANRGTGWLYIPIEGQPTLPLGGVDVYDDHCCDVCNGRARVRCPHCSNGAVSDDLTQSGVMRTPLGNVPYADTLTVQRQCKFCGGTGYVRCPYCSNGYDRGSR
jgi:formylglycine-generating enzyme required for sulfatase activity/Flp pilus assembly protein TadD